MSSWASDFRRLTIFNDANPLFAIKEEPLCHPGRLAPSYNNYKRRRPGITSTFLPAL
jgi:hypothetical protein